MKALPPAYGTWSALVALFAPDVAGEVGAMAGKLSTLIGKTQELPHRDGAEPDGFSGFTRRGPYERLVLSEWALAEEAPDEFLRRAASGEHLFHQVARRANRARRAILVLLDPGPDQVGAPRLGHIAALVSLDRRAAASGALLAWNQLGPDDHLPATEVDALRFSSFVAAHTDRPPAPDTVERAVRGAEQLGELAELWLVGGPSIRELSAPRTARRLVIEETFDPGRRALDFTVEAPGVPLRGTTIDLPEPVSAVRMLRDPFEVRPSARKTLPPKPQGDDETLVLDLSRRVHLSPNGARLLGVTLGGQVVALGVAGLGTTKPPRPRVLDTHAGETAIAIGLLAKQPVSFSLRGSQLVYRHGPQVFVTTHPDATLADLLDTGPALALPLSENASLFYLSTGGAPLELSRTDARWSAIRSELLLVVRCTGAPSAKEAGGGTRLHLAVRRTPEGFAITPPASGIPRARSESDTHVVDAAHPLVAFGARGRSRGWSFVAYLHEAGHWCVLAGYDLSAKGDAQRFERDAPDGPVLGLVPTRFGAALVTRPTDRTLLLTDLLQPTVRRRPFAFPDPIRDVALASEGGIAAATLEDGSVEVIELDLERSLQRVRGRIA